MRATRRGRRASTPSPTAATLRLTWRAVVAGARLGRRLLDAARHRRGRRRCAPPEGRIPLPVPAERRSPTSTAGSRPPATDLEGLQLALPDEPDDVFLAAGAPWFFTLFGRDSIWSARMLLPTGLALAEGTLKVLARLQGERVDPDSAERPGGILHELRRGDEPAALRHRAAAPLLRHDRRDPALDPAAARRVARRPRRRDGARPAAGAPPGARLAPRTRCRRGGFLAYQDESGHGLANQGWKDSGDSIRWHDGRLAEGPIALCEVQAYAHEAAQAARRAARPPSAPPTRRAAGPSGPPT